MLLEEQAVFLSRSNVVLHYIIKTVSIMELKKHIGVSKTSLKDQKYLPESKTLFFLAVFESDIRILKNNNRKLTAFYRLLSS